MKVKIRKQLAKRKRRIERRLDKSKMGAMHRPVMTASNIHYEIGERVRGFAHGGIGAIHLLAREIGLIDEIDRRLHLLKIHMPYHHSDHVLNFAYNALCEGTCLEDIELRRNDEVFLDALGARRIPDPTTSGDFCRRFCRDTIEILQEVFDTVRLRVWSKQPKRFFEQATIDMDGTLVPTTGACKEGMDIAYDGTWGYHPLVLTLAETAEVLRIVNRPGNRPSHEGAAEQVDACLQTCWRGGFRRVLLRGDTDFSQTKHLDRWDSDGRVRFVFGYDAKANVQEQADHLPATSWKALRRAPRYEVKTRKRRKRAKVKDQIVCDREYETLRLQSEEVAEFRYRPSACRRAYRMVVVRKNISKERGELRLIDEVRYFFYITNDWESTAEEVVFEANGRCNQENQLSQLLAGCRALHAPVDNLVSNWAYMVMTSLAWNLKAWWALSLPEKPGRWQERHRDEKRWVLRLEFKTFVQAFMRLPCQLLRSGRRLVYRLMSWNRHLPIFFRLVDALHC